MSITHRRTVVALLVLLGLSLAGALPPGSRVAGRLSTQDCPDVRLNEFLPQPRAVDWNHDGATDPSDQWVELYNGAATPYDLSDWVLYDEGPIAPSKPFTIPRGVTIASYGYLVLYGSDTGIVLHDSSGRLYLRDSDGRTVDQYFYRWSAPDRSWSLTPGGTVWVLSCSPTPGRANTRYCMRYLPLVLAP